MDGSAYHITDTVTVIGNTGNLVKTGYIFTGWNTAANGSGTSYSGGGSFAMGDSHVTLYAQWFQTYTVTYNGNTNTGGTVPTDSGDYENGNTVTVLGNTGTLVKTGYTFAGWNTAANGSGTSRAPSATFAMGAENVTLYAQWTENTYTLTYNGNSSTSGSVPTDGTVYHDGDTVTVLGNTGTLAKTGYTFAGWNTASNGSGIGYIVGDTFTIGTSNVTLYAQWTPIKYSVIYNGNTNTGGSVPIDGNTYQVTDTVTVLGNTGALVKTGYTFAGWNTASNGSGTSRAPSVTFGIGAGNVTLYAQWTVNTPSGGSSNPTTGQPTQPTQPTQETVIVIINGKEQNAGKETKTTEDGKSTVTVEVNNAFIESRVDEAIKNNTTGINNVIQVLVADTKSEVVKVKLTGDIIKMLEENTFEVSIKRDNIVYVIPAKEFTIIKIAGNLNIQEKDLQDIDIEVQITKLGTLVTAKYDEVAKANGAQLIFPPVAFEILAKTTKIDGTTSKVEISKFSNYVERIMEIPAGVGPSKITTGIVFNPDSTYSHVPTEVFEKDSKWYAKLNSLTNSNYSVVWNPVTVKSVEKHWSKDVVNDMASRLVIFNPDSFDPNKAITRADFAEYIVRALGLYKEGSKHENKFKDVSAIEYRTLAILIASEYRIVTGYTDGTFRPDALITREEAMTMYQRAMKVTQLVGTDNIRYKSYTDYNQVGSWAAPYVQEVLSAHIFNGTTATTISPKSNLTYAEAAQAIKNLLVKSKLINK